MNKDECMELKNLKYQTMLLNQKTEKYVDYFVKIKINDKIDSLNISNSAAIVFHHINKNKKIT